MGEGGGGGGGVYEGYEGGIRAAMQSCAVISCHVNFK